MRRWHRIWQRYNFGRLWQEGCVPGWLLMEIKGSPNSSLAWNRAKVKIKKQECWSSPKINSPLLQKNFSSHVYSQSWGKIEVKIKIKVVTRKCNTRGEWEWTREGEKEFWEREWEWKREGVRVRTWEKEDIEEIENVIDIRWERTGDKKKLLRKNLRKWERGWAVQIWQDKDLNELLICKLSSPPSSILFCGNGSFPDSDLPLKF